MFARLFTKPENMPIDSPLRLRLAIEKASRRYKLDRDIISAVVSVESSGNSWATRSEKGFYVKYLQGRNTDKLKGYWPKTRSVETERRYRAGSWGAMQCMGQVARELGFNGDDFTELSKPEIGIDYGCKYLRKLLDLFEGQNEFIAYREALAAYNGGAGNPNYKYADKVLRKTAKHK